MTDRELLLKAKEILFDVAVRQRSGVTDNGAAFVPFETLLACADMVATIEDRLAQPEHLPLAWMHNEITGNVITHIPADIDRHPERWKPLYEAQLQLTESAIARADRAQRLEKKEWVGLTDDEMFDCLLQSDGAAKRLPLGFKWFAEAIEAKLKEKNCG